MTKAQIVVTSCSRRELELEQMRDYLRGNDFEISESDWVVDKNADLIFLSTCGFTKAAEDFGFRTLKRIDQEKKSTAKVVLCGCIPEINPARVNAEFEGPTFSPQSYSRLDGITSAERPFNTFRRPNTVKKRRLLSSLKDDLNKGLQLINAFDGSFSGLESLTRRLGNGVTRRIIRGCYANLGNSTTFYMQIQEGCSMDCSYCSIKAAIGRLRSKSVESILNDFNRGLELGYKNFQFVGDNAGSYGLDIGTNLGELLSQLLEIQSEFKLDLTDINPAYLHFIREPVLELASLGKVARLYVPIQSASPRLLKLMKRACDVQQVKDTLRQIRRAVPNKSQFRLGTSIIVGFPSETDEDLRETIDFCRDIKFDWVWCHSFSCRPETPAASMEDQIDPAETLRRARDVKKELSAESLVTTAEDSLGSRTCQG